MRTTDKEIFFSHIKNEQPVLIRYSNNRILGQAAIILFPFFNIRNWQLCLFQNSFVFLNIIFMTCDVIYLQTKPSLPITVLWFSTILQNLFLFCFLKAFLQGIFFLSFASGGLYRIISYSKWCALCLFLFNEI